MQVPKSELSTYAAQVIRVIVALIEDPEEEVALTAVQGLAAVMFCSLCLCCKVHAVSESFPEADCVCGPGP